MNWPSDSDIKGLVPLGMLRERGLLRGLGGNDQEFGEFAPGMYDYCKKMDLPPNKITPLLKEIFVLSKSVPVSQIPDYIQQQISRKSEVE